MSQTVQEKTRVPVRDGHRSTRRFMLPEALLPKSCLRLHIMCGDDFDQLFSKDECPNLHTLCETLMPSGERCTQIDNVLIVQTTGIRAEVEVQLAHDFTSKAHGRIDAALHACGYEPVFGI